jgi:hypothetical protein
MPIVRQHVAQRRVDAALGRHGMGTGWKYLGNHRDRGIGLRQLQGGTQPTTTRADYQGVEPPSRNIMRRYHVTPTKTSNDHAPMASNPIAIKLNTVSRNLKECK